MDQCTRCPVTIPNIPNQVPIPSYALRDRSVLVVGSGISVVVGGRSPLFLISWGLQITTALIEAIPGMKMAGFSSLKPDTHIAPHKGSVHKQLSQHALIL